MGRAKIRYIDLLPTKNKRIKFLVTNKEKKGYKFFISIKKPIFFGILKQKKWIFICNTDVYDIGYQHSLNMLKEHYE